MKIKQIRVEAFKRFHDLTINLGDEPKKIIALVGPNGCGKSCIFDAFEKKASQYRGTRGTMPASYYSKSLHSPDIENLYHEQNSIQITTQPVEHVITKKSFIIRSAYRYTSRLQMTQLKQKEDIFEDSSRPNSSIQLDARLSDNYERLYSILIDEFNIGKKTGDQVKSELLNHMNNILSRVLSIKISSLGNVTKPNEGQLFFDKGKSEKIPYENLSSGEKEVIDIIIDLIIREKEYDDTVYCIDEPELHLSTAIQRKLLIEINKIIPENCQLWIATHSIGFLRALQEDLKDITQVINFLDQDFDIATTLTPMQPTRNNWKKIFSTALEDLTGLVAPRTLVYCEGRKQVDSKGNEAGLDAIVYNNIFESEFHDTLFVSSGGNTEPDKHAEMTLIILSKSLKDIKLLLLKDKDIQSDGSETTDDQREQWINANALNNRRMLKRKEIENYLFDYEVIQYAYPSVTQQQYSSLINDCENEDVKGKAGELKDLCGVGNKMNNEDFKIHLSKEVTQSMKVYDELKQIIFI